MIFLSTEWQQRNEKGSPLPVMSHIYLNFNTRRRYSHCFDFDLRRRLNVSVDMSVKQEREFAQWQLNVEHGKHTDRQDNVTLPESLYLENNTITGLINYIYPNIGQLQPSLHQFFSEWIMLSSRNVDVDEINEIILNQFPGEVRKFHSADWVVNDSPENDILSSFDICISLVWYLLHFIIVHFPVFISSSLFGNWTDCTDMIVIVILYIHI